jgi:hypothetical protein
MFWPWGRDCVANPPNFVFGDASMMVEMVADQVVGWHQSVTSTISTLNRKKVDCQVMCLCWCFSAWWGKCGACAVVGCGNEF